MAAVLEMRGYPSPRRAPRRLGSRSRHDLAFAAAASAITLLAVADVLAGGTGFHAYPLLNVAFDPALVGVALLYPAIALAPFLDRQGIEP